MCAVCPGAGLFAGWIAPKIGINTPTTERGRQVASVLTALTTAVTVLALKVFFQFSLCGGSGSLFYRLAVAGIKVVPLALTYGLIFNALIGSQEQKDFTNPIGSQEQKDFTSPKKGSCCHSHTDSPKVD